MLRVDAITYNAATKSKLGWDFLAVVETWRFKDWHDPQDGRQDERSIFWKQLEHCEMEVLSRPNRSMKWGVPDGTRDAGTVELVHDDLVLSAALCAVLDGVDWVVSTGAAYVVPRRDPLAEIDEEGF